MQHVDDGNSWISRLRGFGWLRHALLLATLVLIVFVPPPGTRAVLTGWPLVTTVLIPVLAPMTFMVLLLDALMARVFLTDAEGAARQRYKTILLVDLLAAAVLLLRWLPYFAALRV